MKKQWLYLLGSGIIALLLVGGWWWTREPEAASSVFENDPLVLEQRELFEDEQSDSLLEAPLVKTEPLPGAAEPSITKETTQSPLPDEAVPVSSRPTISDGATTSILIQDRLIAFGHRTPGSPRPIDTVVLHSSYNASGGDAYNLEKIIGQYEQYGVGAHYIIDRSGSIYRLVKEEGIAYHAGESKMPDGRKNVNDFSIGIELVATEESGYTEKQYTAVNNLIADIKTRYKIKDIVGHGDIAPKRKTDPWKFDWKKLE